MSHISLQDKPFIVSGSLFVASFVLEGYMAMFSLPVSQYDMLDWISWILGMGGVIMFVSALINHKSHK
ncbi:MAG: hypothetical protein AAB908_02215 [Patescibacteria group bacterium]